MCVDVSVAGVVGFMGEKAEGAVQENNCPKYRKGLGSNVGIRIVATCRFGMIKRVNNT